MPGRREKRICLLSKYIRVELIHLAEGGWDYRHWNGLKNYEFCLPQVGLGAHAYPW